MRISKWFTALSMLPPKRLETMKRTIILNAGGLANDCLLYPEPLARNDQRIDQRSKRKSEMGRDYKSLRQTLALLLVTLVMGAAAFDARGEAASTPAGFYKLDCLGNSDTIVSIPFTRPETNSSLVQSIAGSEVTVAGMPGWLVDQFVYVSGTQSNTYYLRFLTGAKEGSYYPIVANGTNSLTLSLGGDDISSVTNGTRLSVIPYWTLGTAFPGGKGVMATALSFSRKTEVMIPNVNGVGINLSPGSPYYFLTNVNFPNGIWQQAGASPTNKNDDVLLPDNYFIVRNNTASSTVFTAQGSVPTSRLTVPLAAENFTKQDNFVALTRPATNTLNESGLIQSGAFLGSPTTFSRTDELLVFNNEVAAKNKAPTARYFYLSPSNTWCQVGSGTTDMGNQPVFTPGTGFIIRKQTNAVSSLWSNLPNY